MNNEMKIIIMKNNENENNEIIIMKNDNNEII